MEELDFYVTTEEQKTADRNGDNKWKKQKRKKTSRRFKRTLKHSTEKRIKLVEKFSHSH